ncbi:hypothetical protein SJA_C1-17110 [Sphingobium indicum UT26S]|uniref:Uncharacterized protein n=1 Tax=Sphingobium indicum (strain DSM 16413 / CCM 7287 / MTCC 6362 / UT26 / NBRC 101211 / UT26S) TaxID=452662 RepID=D4Z1R3_SPHIU|nr:hypothetical protein SJA_C1-17110 [Sphingobium indicum UT26S]
MPILAKSFRYCTVWTENSGHEGSSGDDRLVSSLLDGGFTNPQKPRRPVFRAN